MKHMGIAALLALLLLWPCAAPARALDDAQRADGGQDDVQDGWLTDSGGTSFFIGPLDVVPPAQGLRLTRKAVAVPETADGTVAMHEQPYEESAVLMTYYRGAPLEVIRASVNGFYQVQAGAAEAGVMGYMRAQDIQIGEQADREVAPSYMELQFNREATIYAYCDENAEVIGTCTVDHTYYAMGKNDGRWVQLTLPPVFHFWEEEDRPTVGFVKLETGVARGYWHEMTAWVSSPVTGEVSEEQIVELAIVGITNQNTSYGIPDVFRQRATLEKMESRVFLDCPTEDRKIWKVCFWETAGTDAVVAVLEQSKNNQQWYWWRAGYYSSEDSVHDALPFFL